MRLSCRLKGSYLYKLKHAGHRCQRNQESSQEALSQVQECLSKISPTGFLRGASYGDCCWTPRPHVANSTAAQPGMLQGVRGGFAWSSCDVERVNLAGGAGGMAKGRVAVVVWGYLVAVLRGRCPGRGKRPTRAPSRWDD
jgi:hypothetical protein